MPETDLLTFRRPDKADGADIWNFVKRCKPLDENSMYCNLIQCDHFRDTCIVAELDGQIVGWVSAYILPDDPEALFVWQVAVSEAARGRGLGHRMLRELLDRDACGNVKRLQTTITKDNDASWGLFRSFARHIGGALSDEPHFEKEAHFEGRHDTEYMVTIELPAPVPLRRAA